MTLVYISDIFFSVQNSWYIMYFSPQFNGKHKKHEAYTTTVLKRLGSVRLGLMWKSTTPKQEDNVK